MGASEVTRDGIRNLLGWAVVVLLFVPWLIIQLAAGLTRWLAHRRGGID